MKWAKGNIYGTSGTTMVLPLALDMPCATFPSHSQQKASPDILFPGVDMGNECPNDLEQESQETYLPHYKVQISFAHVARV